MGAETLKTPKRGDLVVDEIKRWIIAGELNPGEKLPKEVELQELFGVSKSTIRDALKSLEVQGLVKISTGPTGGGTVVPVTLDRTFQLMQNYLFFQEIDIQSIYAVRRLLEPELAAGAVEHLTERHFEALEASLDVCEPMARSKKQALAQRKEELHFHEILAEANPNALLKFYNAMITRIMTRRIHMMATPKSPELVELGRSVSRAHRAIVDAARARDADKVRRLMTEHLDEAEAQVIKFRGSLTNSLVLESEMRTAIGRPVPDIIE